MQGSVVFEKGMRDIERIVVEGFAAFARGDLGYLLDHTTEDVEVHQPPTLPDARSYRGHDGLLEVLQTWPEQWDEFSYEFVELIPVDDDRFAIALMIQHLRARELALNLEVWSVYERDEGPDAKFKSWHMFLSLEEAQEHVRLRAASPRSLRQ
jgi:ketosteroid isomerase-like protein